MYRIGFWKYNRMHGYGRVVHTDGEMQEGLYDNDKFKASKKDVEGYNPNIHLISRKIVFGRYCKGTNLMY